MSTPSRTTILKRAASGQCPNCETNDLFASRFRMHATCPGCGLPMEQEDGWSLGAIPLNYAITCICWVLPVAVLFLAGFISFISSLIAAGIGCLILPLLTYRFSKKLWLGIYYAVLPHEMSPFRKQQRDAR